MLGPSFGKIQEPIAPMFVARMIHHRRPPTPETADGGSQESTH